MKYLIISPHLDDAVLSCGDYIDYLVSKGNIVDVLTIFSLNVPRSSLSSAAKMYHSNCFLNEDAMNVRKKEDFNALSNLKSNGYYLDYPECLYRKDSKGYIYPDLNNIYNIELKREQDTIKKLSNDLKKHVDKYDVVLSPLGLGSHADHLLVNKAVDNIINKKAKFYFYEEVAYVCYYYRENKLSNWGKNMNNIIIELSNENYFNKIKSILMYRSQLHILWKNYLEMERDLENLSKKYGFSHSIRLWSYYDYKK